VLIKFLVAILQSKGVDIKTYAFILYLFPNFPAAIAAILEPIEIPTQYIFGLL
jgi:hypothetical protein